MKLQIGLRRCEIAVFALFSALTVYGQATPDTVKPASQREPVISARVSPGPLDSSSTLGAGSAESAAVLSSSAVLPLTPQPVIKPSNTRPEVGLSARELQVWKGLLVAEHSAAIFDAWTTRKSLQSGNGYERNPLLKPFADSAAIYPMLQIAPVGFDFLSHRMMRSQHRFFRKTWWVPQLLSTGASLWCGSRNLRVASLNR